jgi:pilus assembly protein FimV
MLELRNQNKGWSVPAPDRRHLSHCVTSQPSSHATRANFATRRMASLISALFIAMPLAASAAGLGKLTVTSGLGQPLRAEIEISAASKEELSSLSARMAPPDAYAQANLEYSSALSTLKFAIEKRPSGQNVVVITSVVPVNDPYIDLLLELDWSTGRLVREYTFLLDPPESKRQAPIVAPVAPSITLPARRPSESQATPTPAAPPPAPIARVTPTPPPAPVRAPAAPQQTGDYQVKQGDTLAQIARTHMAPGATLDQMLLALLKANPSAFDDGNVNRLKAGATLSIPDAAAASSATADDAHKAVVAQSADFSAYRTRLAGGAAAAPVASTPDHTAQSTSGKVTAPVDERKAPIAQTADQLKLSRAKPTALASTNPNGTSVVTTTSAPAGSAAAAAANKQAAANAEDLAVKERALKESSDRVKLLEKNVSDLQKLLELKNQNLADLQRQAETKDAQLKAARTAAASAPPPVAAPAPTPTPAPAPVTPPAPPPVAVVATPVAPPVAPPPPAAAPVTAPAPVVVASTPAPSDQTAANPAPAPSKPVVRAPAPQGSFIDDLLGNTVALFGLIALVIVLIIAYLVYRLRRNKRFAKFEDSILTGTSGLHANSVFGTTGGQSVDTSNSSFNSNFVPLSGQVDTNEVDPVAEADVYIAYGRDAQAEEILKEALRAQPDRQAVRLKLLEIYAKRQDAKAFETVASELYASSNGQGDDWRRAAALGASFDAANPLYRDAAAAAPVAPPPMAGGSSAAFEKTQTLGPAAAAAASAGAIAGAAAGAAAAVAATVVTPRFERAIESDHSGQAFTNTLPLEPILDLDLTKTEPMPESQVRAPEPASSAMDLDFDLGFGAAAAAAAPHPAPSDPNATTMVLTKDSASPNPLDFDLDLSGSVPIAETPLHERTVVIDSKSKAAAASPIPSFDATLPNMTTTVAVPREPTTPDDAPNIDFNLDVPPAGASPPSGSFERTHAGSETQSSFGGITLDLDNGSVADQKPPVEGGTRWQEMATKLDLAIAYRDIGDKDGARELLEEVLKDGDAAQVGKARELMSALA